MTERKFTPPTEFPAEYVNRNGDKAVILGRGPRKELPFVGHDAAGNACSWTEKGEYYTEGTSPDDLHDIPQVRPSRVLDAEKLVARIEELEAELTYLERWRAAAFIAHGNLDLDIEADPQALAELK